MMLEDRLSALKPQAPTDAEIAHLLATADRRTRRRRVRIAGGALLATAAATFTLAALPSEQAPTTVAAILESAASTAADQDAPPAWTGYRYLQSIDRRESRGYTIERTEEEWIDSTWQGRYRSQARLVSGTITAPELPAKVRAKLTDEQLEQSERSAQRYPESVLAPRDLTTPRDMPNLYGDGALAKVPLQDLPTDPGALGKLLVEAHKDGRWTPGGGWNPLADSIHREVLSDVLLLLAKANVTPGQRAALISVLGNYDGATPLPETQDRRGRTGRGVEIAGVKIVFDPDTSELLEWSEGGEAHTFLRSGRVAELGQRPQ
jgi:hypothetical protein